MGHMASRSYVDGAVNGMCCLLTQSGDIGREAAADVYRLEARMGALENARDSITG